MTSGLRVGTAVCWSGDMLLCCCRFELPLFEVETDEELSGDGTILTPTNAAAINTIPAPQQVTFNPGLQNNPFALHFNLLAVAESDMIDRETRELYTLPVASTSAEGDTAFATVSLFSVCNFTSVITTWSLVAAGNCESAGCQ